MRKKILLAMALMGLSALMVTGCASPVIESKKEILESELGSKNLQDSDEDSDDGKSIEETEMAASEDTTEEEAASASYTSIKEQVLLDKDGVKVTATGYSVNEYDEDQIEVTVENNTDKDLTIGSEKIVINGYMDWVFWGVDVASGKKCNSYVTLSDDTTKIAGITNIGTVEFYFWAEDKDSYEDIFKDEYYKLETSQVGEEVDANTNKQEIYNADGIRITALGNDTDEYGNTNLYFCMENNTGKDVYVNLEDMSIDGLMFDAYVTLTVFDGRKGIGVITLYKDDLEESKISEIKNVEFKLEMEDTDTMDDILTTDVIKFPVE